MSNNEALRLINNRQNAHLISWQANACAELRRLHDLLGKANALCRIRAEEIERLKAQPEQEPVATRENKYGMKEWQVHALRAGWSPTPPHRKPLSDEELRVIENKINPNMRWRSSDEEGITLYPSEYYELVRAIEAAHGIKE